MSAPKKKKTSAKPKKRRRTTRSKKPVQGTGLKITLALFILAGIVAGSGWLLHRYLPPAPPSTAVVPLPKEPRTAKKAPAKTTPAPKDPTKPNRPPGKEI